ncbi:MAG: type VI secretion system protein TssA [Gammaproteobacteria bacterium]|nr:MAG: type VI secretion system protein TssA [Gammaproteobacteria bacterium]
MNAVVEQPIEAPLSPPLLACLEPLDNGGCGEDPRHGDRFFLLKQEVERSHKIKLEAIRSQAIELLREEARDLRVLAWLVWPLAIEEGAEGLAQALTLMAENLDRYGDALHPRKPGLRAAALRWLAGNKPRHAIEGALGKADAQALERIEAALARIHAAGGEWLGDVLDWLNPLLEAAGARCRQAEPAKEEEAEGEAAEQPVPAAAEGGQKAAEARPAGIATDNDFNRHAREMLAWLEERNEHARAFGLRRSLRWSGLVPPPAEQGRTRLPPPRAEARRAVAEAAAQGRHQDVLSQGEALFMEPGGHFWLELQFHEFEAARALGKGELAALIETETAALLKRLPMLTSLSFEDETPFAGAVASDWLAGLASGEDRGRGGEHPDDDLPALRQEAQARAGEAGLHAGLAVLQGAPAADAPTRLQLRLWMAELSLAHERADLAAALLEEEGSGTLDIGVWQPALGFELARLRLRVARARAAALKGAAAEEWQRRAEDAWRDMCRLDAARAAQAV